jgi:protein-S-isoprenylcysteine O-methyltransferase Ste14
VAFPVITAAFFYGATRQTNGEGERVRIPAIPGFRFAYRWVQLSTAAIVLGELFFDGHWALLQVFGALPLTYLGVAICVVAGAIFIWAKVRLGGQFSPCCDSLVANRLIDTGPYAYVRHPIYSANLAWQLGALLATGSLWIIINVAILLLYYVTSARQEEQALSKELPEYRDYMARTGAFLPPPLPRRAR